MKKCSAGLVRLLCLMLCVSTLAVSAPTVSAAQESSGWCGENLTWTLNDQGTLTISGTGDMETYVKGSSPWYDQREMIKSVVITNGVTSIGASAFEDCSSLQSVALPEGVGSIEDWAFAGCSGLTGISIANGVTTIGYGAFYGCSVLTDVALPKSLVGIGDCAFYGCSSLTAITIPESVTDIGDSAFSNCSTLTTVRFCGNAPTIGTNPFYGVAATAYYPEGNETWTRAVMQNFGSKLTWVVYSGSEIEKFDINLAQAVLGNALNLYFLFPADAYADWTGCYAVVTKTYADGRDDLSIIVPASKWQDKTSGSTMLKRVGFYNISAKEMGDEIRIVVYNADGKAISNQGSDSLSSYLIRMLTKNSNAKFRRLAVDMLNYGAAAQEQFRYNSDHLVNAGLTEAQKAYGTTESAACENKQVKDDSVRGISVSLDNNIVMRIYFTGQTADMKATVTFKNHAGTSFSSEVTSAITANGYCFVVDQIAVADMRTVVTVTAYNADGSIYGSISDSVEGYVARTGSTKAINQAILKLSDAAYAYLH